MRTLVDSKINVTKLPRLEKWDCSNYFLLKGHFHSAVEGGWVACNVTVVTFPKHFTRHLFCRRSDISHDFLNMTKGSQGWSTGSLSCALSHSFTLPLLLSLMRKTLMIQTCISRHTWASPSAISQVTHGTPGAEELCGMCSAGAASHSPEHPTPSPGLQGYLLHDAQIHTDTAGCQLHSVFVQLPSSLQRG